MTTKISELHIYIDGGSKGNPGPSAIGIVFRTPEGAEIWSKAKDIGHGTNNQAEYTALVEALKAAKRFHPNSIKVFSDSKLLVNQMNHVYKIKNDSIKELFLDAWNRVIDYKGKVTFTHIPREQNQEADALTNSFTSSQKLL